MISAYERGKRQPTLETLLRLLRAAGFELRMHLAPYESHDDVLGELEAARTPRERTRRDRQVAAWRRAVPARTETQNAAVEVADLADVIRSKEAAGRPKDVRVLPALYRHLASRREPGTR